MNIKRPFAPSFLNKLDNFLLLNKASIWAARAHLAVYYSLLFILALAAVYFAVPDDPRSDSSLFVWVGFLTIICIIALVGWLIYLLRFNVFKRFGSTKPVTTLIDFLLYFITTSVIVSFCLVPVAIETFKANRQYSGSELVNDINNINLKICQFEYDSLPKKWRGDTLLVHDTLPKGQTPTEPIDYYDDEETTVTTDTAYSVSVKYYRLIDTLALSRMIKSKDSLNKINDSIYVLYHCPNYTLLSVYNFRSPIVSKLLSSEQIFHKVIERYVVPNKNKVRTELNSLLDKYYYKDNDKIYFDNNPPRQYEDKMKKFYRINNIATGIEHVAERKYRWANDGDAFLMIWFYFSFVITLLVFAFRYSTVRVFFLSLLSIIIIFILTMLLTVFLRSNGIEYFLWLIFYFVLFMIVSATTFRDKTRRIVKGIAINLFMFMLPFLPLIFTGMYYTWLRQKYSSVVSAQLLINYQAMSMHFLLAQIAGPVIFLILLVVYLHPIYRRWYGLPEE